MGAEAPPSASEAHTGWRHEYRYVRESRASLVYWTAMSAVLAAGVAGGGAWLIRSTDLSYLHLWPAWMRLLFYALNLLVFGFTPLALFAWHLVHLSTVRAHADDVVVLDGRGLTLRRNGAEESFRWEETDRMSEHLAGYRLRTRKGVRWIAHGFENEVTMLAELRAHLPSARK